MENTEIKTIVEVTEDTVPEVIEMTTNGKTSKNGLIIAGVTLATAAIGYGAYRGIKFVRGKIKAKKEESSESENDIEDVETELETIEPVEVVEPVKKSSKKKN